MLATATINLSQLLKSLRSACLFLKILCIPSVYIRYNTGS